MKASGLSCADSFEVDVGRTLLDGGPGRSEAAIHAQRDTARFANQLRQRVETTAKDVDCTSRETVWPSIVTESSAWASAVVMSVVKSAIRLESWAMVSGSSRSLRRARNCSSAWFFFRMDEPLQLGVGFGEGEHGRVARGDRFDLGIGEFLAADVLGTAKGIVAGHHLGDEAGFGFQGLPHIGVERSLGHVAINRDFLVLVALPENSALALFDLGRLPGSIQMVQGDETLLDVGAGAHLLACCREAPGPGRCVPSRRGLASWRRSRHRRWRRSARGGCHGLSASR